MTTLSKPGGGEFGKYFSLPALDDPRIGEFERFLGYFFGDFSLDFGYLWCYFVDRLPYSIRILLESAIRNCDGFQVMEKDVEKILDWENTAPKQVEIPFKPARVLLQVLFFLLLFFNFNFLSWQN